MKKYYLFILSIITAFTSFSQVTLRYGENIDAGYGDASVITPYVHFPAEFLSPYNGCTITTVEIGVMKKATNVSLYLRHNPKDDDYFYRQKITSLEPGWNTIVLDTPYVIGENEEIAVGYKGTFSESQGVGYSSENWPDGDYVYNNSKSQWGKTYGSICIRAIVEGDNLPTNELMIEPLRSTITPEYEAEEIAISGKVRNMGANDVEGYSIILSVDGSQVKEKPIDHTVALNSSDSFELTLPLSDIPFGKHTLCVGIGKAGDSEDIFTHNNETSVGLTIRNPQFRRKVVCEEGTGLWCGWCPKGLVGIELMKEKYPDSFFGISIHSGDVLTISNDEEYTYHELTDQMAGFPYAFFNRRFSGSPYEDMDRLTKLELDAESPIAVEMNADWNEDNTEIVATIDIVPGADIQNADYYVSVALLEDGITGYYQTNYFSDGQNGEFYGWEEKTNPTDDVVFNDLARGIFPSYQGQSLGYTSLEADNVYQSVVTITPPETIVDYKNLHLVAMVVNAATGFIDNSAACAPIITNGVATLSQSRFVTIKNGAIIINSPETGSYRVSDVSGRLVATGNCMAGKKVTLDNMAHGIYIIAISSTSGIKSEKIML